MRSLLRVTANTRAGLGFDPTDTPHQTCLTPRPRASFLLLAGLRILQSFPDGPVHIEMFHDGVMDDSTSPLPVTPSSVGASCTVPTMFGL